MTNGQFYGALDLTCLLDVSPLGELAPHLGRPLVGIFLRESRDPDQSIRASSLSNLGEICQRLDYSLGSLAQEVGLTNRQ